MIIEDTAELFGFLEKGHFARDLMSAVQEVTTCLANLGEGKGAVGFTISFDNKGPILSIATDIKVTLPKKKRRASAAFLTEDGQISLQHPDQAPLNLPGGGGRRDPAFDEMRRKAEDTKT